MTFADQIDKKRMPKHIAIIMDGNGRWAKERGHERSYGHAQGVDVVRKITDASSRLGIQYLTLYAFSTENWNRPQEEVNILMSLIVSAIERETPDLIKNNVRLSTIGDFQRMPADVQERLAKCIRDTSAGTGLTLNLALSYSSRWELVDVVKKIAKQVQQGDIEVDEITESTITDALSTASMPDPDLLIRTGGEVRISNFLLWQLSYAELYFTAEYWPDFNEESLYKAIYDYQSRERRFVKISEQL